MSNWIAFGVPLLIVGLGMLDELQRFYRSFDRNVRENELLPTRWIAWGAIISVCEPWINRRYFFVRLPGASWEKDPWRDSWGWHNRVLTWVHGSPYGWRGWHVSFVRCPDAIQ